MVLANVPSFRFFVRGEHPNVPSFRFFVLGEHPNVPSFRWHLCRAKLARKVWPFQNGNHRMNWKMPPKRVTSHDFSSALVSCLEVYHRFFFFAWGGLEFVTFDKGQKSAIASKLEALHWIFCFFVQYCYVQFSKTSYPKIWRKLRKIQWRKSRQILSRLCAVMVFSAQNFKVIQWPNFKHNFSSHANFLHGIAHEILGHSWNQGEIPCELPLRSRGF